MNNLDYNYTYNAVYLNGNKIIDISNTDTTPDEVDAGNVFYSADGTPVVGTKDIGSNQSDWTEKDTTSPSFIKNKLPLSSTENDGIFHTDISGSGSTEVYSRRSVALNTSTIAGANAFYIGSITSNEIYLSNSAVVNTYGNISTSIASDIPLTYIQNNAFDITAAKNTRIAIVLTNQDTSEVNVFEATVNSIYTNKAVINYSNMPNVIPSGFKFREGYCFFIDLPKFGTTTIGENSFAGGNRTKALNNGTFSFGFDNAALAPYSVSFGSGNIAGGENTLVSGDENLIFGRNSVGFGTANLLTGRNSAIFGFENTIFSDNSFSTGKNNRSVGKNSASFGYSTAAEGENSLSIGEETAAKAKSTFAAGTSTIAGSDNQFVIGKYNVSDVNSKFAFIVGWGSDYNNRKNIFDITTDGTGTFYNNLNVEKNSIIKGTLTLDDAATLKSTLSVSGNAEFGTDNTNTLTVRGSETVNGNLTVSGTATLNGANLGVTTIATADTTANVLTVNGVTNMNSVLNVNAPTNVWQLLVSDTATFKNNISLTGNLTLTSGSKIFIGNKELNIANTQPNWAENDSSKPSYILNKPAIVQADWNVSETTDPAYIKNKPSIPAAQVQSDWNESNTSSLSYIKNKPTIPAAQIQSDWNESNTSSLAYIKNKPSVVQADWNETSTTSMAYILNKPIDLVRTNELDETNERLSALEDSINKNATQIVENAIEELVENDKFPAADWNKISNKPSNSDFQADWTVSDTNSLAYIKNKPSIPAAQIQSDWNEADTSSMAYIQNKPSIPAAQIQSDWNESNALSLAYIKNKPSVVQSDWNEADTSSMAYIQNKPSIPAAQIQSDWNEADTSSMSYIKNKIPVEADEAKLTIRKGKITLTDGEESVSFTISDLRKLLSLLNNVPGLITAASVTTDENGIVLISEGTDTTSSEDYN